MVVLVIESDPGLRYVITELLAMQSIRAECLSQGEDIISKIENSRPILVFMDLALSSVDGFSILSQLKNHPIQEVSKTPLILMSSMPRTTHDLQMFLQAGAAGFLQKPFDLDLFEKIVMRYSSTE